MNALPSASDPDTQHAARAYVDAIMDLRDEIEPEARGVPADVRSRVGSSGL